MWGTHRHAHFPDTANLEMSRSSDYPQEGKWSQGQVGERGREGACMAGHAGLQCSGPHAGWSDLLSAMVELRNPVVPISELCPLRAEIPMG